MSAAPPKTAPAGSASPVPPGGTRKAAILMMSLGQDVSAEILKRLSEDEVRRITAEVTRIKALTPEQAEQVLAEFHRTIAGGAAYAVHGADFAKDMLVNALGAEPARKVLDQVSRQANMDAERSHRDGERRFRSTGALHPAGASPDAGHHLFPTGPDDRGLSLAQILHRRRVPTWSGAWRVSRRSLRRCYIGSAPHSARRCAHMGEFRRKPYGGRRAVAEILANFDGAVTEEILASIEKTNPEIGEESSPSDGRV